MLYLNLTCIGARVLRGTPIPRISPDRPGPDRTGPKLSGQTFHTIIFGSGRVGSGKTFSCRGIILRVGSGRIGVYAGSGRFRLKLTLNRPNFRGTFEPYLSAIPPFFLIRINEILECVTNYSLNKLGLLATSSCGLVGLV